MIRIKNIYYMLSYAFQALNSTEYKSIKTEEFENTSELFSEILIIGVSRQVKQGLLRDYADKTETTSSVRGKINIEESLNGQSFYKKQLSCTYDEFSVDCYLNRIIKSTMNMLLKSDISGGRKKKLRNLLRYFENVTLVDVESINWKIRFVRNTQTYRMLIGVCWLAVEGLLQSEVKGKSKLMEFLDNQRMSRLYEKFILNYYKKEHPEITVSASQIKWQLDDGNDFMLPRMQSVVYLEYCQKILIIDAKYYSSTTQKNWDSHSSLNKPVSGFHIC